MRFLIVLVFEDEENIVKCGENDLVCCKNNWFVLGPGGSYDTEVYIQRDHPNYCGIFAEGSCKRRQSCGKIGNCQLCLAHDIFVTLFFCILATLIAPYCLFFEFPFCMSCLAKWVSKQT